MTARHRSGTSPATAAYAGAPVAGDHVPWRRAHYCVVDLELSGLDPATDEVVSFAAVPVDGGRIVAGGTLYGLCRPTRPLSERSVLIHGLRTVDLADAPPLDEAIEPLLTVMTGRILVAHVARIETAFLEPILRRRGIRLRRPVIDTAELARLLALEHGRPPGNPTLTDLADGLGLPVHRPHHALGDALTTAQVFIALASHLDGIAPQTVRSLARPGRRIRALSVYPPDWAPSGGRPTRP